MARGDIYTIPGLAGVAVDNAGNVLAAKEFAGESGTIWLLAGKSGTFYGHKVRAWKIYMIAG